MKYTEQLNFITHALMKFNIPYKVKPWFDGWEIGFPWTFGKVSCHVWTHPNLHGGKVETFNFPWDWDNEYEYSKLSVKEVVEKISLFYNEEKKLG